MTESSGIGSSSRGRRTAGGLRSRLAREVHREGQLQHPADGTEPEAVAQVLDPLLGLVRGRPIWANTNWRPPNLVGPPQLGILFAELLQPSSSQLVRRPSRAPASAWRTQERSFLVDAEAAGDVRYRAAVRADLADGALAQFIGALPWCRHCCVWKSRGRALSPDVVVGCTLDDGTPEE